MRRHRSPRTRVTSYSPAAVFKFRNENHMANPIFITVVKTGAIYASIDPNFVPASGTVAAVFKVSSQVSSQLLGTVTGAGSPNYLCSGDVGNKHSGKEST